MTLAVLVLGCRPTAIVTPEPGPDAMEPVAIGSLVRSEGRIGPDPDAPEHHDDPLALGPLTRFSGEALARVVDPDGLVITDHALGSGPEARAGDVVRFHYVGTLQDGHEVDSSHARGTPFEFRLGSGMLIQGMERGLIGVRVGMLRTLSIPPALGYGEQGAGSSIPANATLVFYIEVLAVEPIEPPLP